MVQLEKEQKEQEEAFKQKIASLEMELETIKKQTNDDMHISLKSKQFSSKTSQKELVVSLIEDEDKVLDDGSQDVISHDFREKLVNYQVSPAKNRELDVVYMEQSSIEKRSIEKEEDENWQFMDEFQNKQMYASLHE